jgi:hypothetical protein
MRRDLVWISPRSIACVSIRENADTSTFEGDSREKEDIERQPGTDFEI